MHPISKMCLQQQQISRVLSSSPQRPSPFATPQGQAFKALSSSHSPLAATQGQVSQRRPSPFAKSQGQAFGASSFAATQGQTLGPPSFSAGAFTPRQSSSAYPGLSPRPSAAIAPTNMASQGDLTNEPDDDSSSFEDLDFSNNYHRRTSKSSAPQNPLANAKIVITKLPPLTRQS